MITIKRLKNQENMHYYLFDNGTNTHNDLIGFLNNAGFSNDDCDEIDTPLLELNGECLSVQKKDIKIHFFICNDKTWMIIDSNEPQKKIMDLMKKYFLFPK